MKKKKIKQKKQMIKTLAEIFKLYYSRKTQIKPAEIEILEF